MHRWLDGRLQFNLIGYHQVWEDMQLELTDPSYSYGEPFQTVCLRPRNGLGANSERAHHPNGVLAGSTFTTTDPLIPVEATKSFVTAATYGRNLRQCDAATGLRDGTSGPKLRQGRRSRLDGGRCLGTASSTFLNCFS